MDNDATTLQNALDVLREHFGNQSHDRTRVTEADLRYTLEQRMGLDELAADRVVKKLQQTGRLSFAPAGAAQNDFGDNATGLIIEIPGAEVPLAESQLLTTTLPGLLPSSANNPAGGVTAGFPIGPKAAEAVITDAGALGEGPVPERDVPARRAERNEGATMGQLGDTNVEGGEEGMPAGERPEITPNRTDE